MELLYSSEHLKCMNYDLNSNPIVKEITIKQNEEVEIELTKAEIIFQIKGRILISYEHMSEVLIKEQQILFFPPGSRLIARATEDSSILVYRIFDTVKLCDAYTPEDLFKEDFETDEKLFPLPFNDRIRDFLNGLLPCIREGLRCNFYLDAKLKELFFLFRAYYTKEELYNFFHPFLSNDTKFSQFVWSNYRKVSTVAEFAELCNYSTSRFKSKFKDVFGVSALQWMNNQRARNIYFDLKFSDKSLVDISDEYHFASPSYLSTFCKKNFSLPPKDIRSVSFQKK